MEHAHRTYALVVGLAAAAVAPNALAFRWDRGNGLIVNFDTTLSYGVQVRTQDRYQTLIGNDNGGSVPVTGDIGEVLHGPGGGAAANPDFNFLNGDNGNLNYDQWDVTSSVIKGTHELGIKWGDGWEFLGRMSWLYDHAVGDTNFMPLSDQAKDIAELNLTPLDLWISKDFDFFGQPAKVRLGNQVVSWGEDIFILGGINSINALDIRRFRTPGTQIKEVLRPAPMFYFNAGITDGLSVEGYYQFIWNEFRLDPVGTFLSGADVAGKGQLDAFAPTSFGLCVPFNCGDDVLTPSIPGANIVPKVRTDRDPEKTGQYGIAFRYIPESIEAEFGLYFIHYHDKLPFTSFIFDPNLSSLVNPAAQANLLGLGYFNEFGEDKNLFGFSANTKVGPVAVGTEVSYRPEESVAIDPTVPIGAGLQGAFGFPFQGLAPGSSAMGHSIMDVVGCGLGTDTAETITAGPGKTFDATACTGYTRGFVEEEKYQAHLTGFYFIEINSIFGRAMQAVGAAEGYALAEIAVTYFPSLDPRHVPYLIFPSYAVPDKTSAGYVFELALTYPDALYGFNLTPQIDFYHDFEGTSPNTIPFVEGRKAVFLALNFDLNSVWKGQIGYTSYFGGGNTNIIRDRDFLGVSASFAF
jgi:Protein of unknown function (DUF1302)